MTTNATKQVYRIIFYQDDNRYDLYAKHGGLNEQLRQIEPG